MKKILSFVIAAMMVVMMLPAVVSAAIDQTGAEYTLTADETLTDEVLIIVNDFVLDLGGKTITSTHEDFAIVVTGPNTDVTIKNGKIIMNGTGQGQAVRVVDGANVILEDLTIEATGYGVVVRDNTKNSHDEATARLDGNPVDVTINNCDITAGVYGISGNGYDHFDGANITINGDSTIEGEDVGIYIPNAGTLTLNDGYITGKTGIEMRAGDLVIPTNSRVVVEGTGTPLSQNPNGSGSTTVGAAIAVSQHTTNLPISVEIGAGTFISESNASLYEIDAEDEVTSNVTISVTGGNFEGAVSSENCESFISGGSFDTELNEDYITADKEYNEELDRVVCVEHGDWGCYDNEDGTHRFWCRDCQTRFIEEPHNFTEWEREGAEMARYCVDCGARETAELTEAEKISDYFANFRRFLLWQLMNGKAE
ncbi:MAG: hypothetical protein IJC71_07065 [Clostridia bacterium]|nr:hypothetical protein [Clostridia bacterium]